MLRLIPIFRFQRFLTATLISAMASLSCLPSPSAAADGDKPPLPRFVSLRSDRINVRIGPGERYPVEWVYRWPNLPIEIIAEFGNWRKIRDFEGVEGWVHQTMVSGRRTIIVVGGVRNLYRDRHPQSPVIAALEEGVIGRLLQCPENTDACKVNIMLPDEEGSLRIRRKSVQGWLHRSDFWGVYPSEYIE